MNIRFTPILVALLGFAAVTQPVMAAASKKEAARTAALVAALQAVSPDPLGGRLGLAATQSRTEATPVVTAAPAGRNVTRFDLDQRAYVIWKSSQKS
jgi:hypothetical protein